MQLYLHEAGAKAANRSIFITGCGRSGTTILGKLIHSMQDVEYTYEPALLLSLLPLIDTLDPSHFRLLFETYLYEELLMGQITGRGVNLNENDDSCVYNGKSKTEIQNRLKTAWNKLKAADRAENVRLAFKMPDLPGPLLKLMELYPGLRPVLLQRKANPVIESTLKKKWFTDESLNRGMTFWPSQSNTGLMIPSWIENEKIPAWRKWTEVERAAYYYVRITHQMAQVENAVVVSYEKLVQEPPKTVKHLSDQLGLQWGELTQSLVDKISLRNTPSEDWTERLDPLLRKQVLESEALLLE